MPTAWFALVLSPLLLRLRRPPFIVSLPSHLRRRPFMVSLSNHPRLPALRPTLCALGHFLLAEGPSPFTHRLSNHATVHGEPAEPPSPFGPDPSPFMPRRSNYARPTSVMPANPGVRSSHPNAPRFPPNSAPRHPKSFF